MKRDWSINSDKKFLEDNYKKSFEYFYEIRWHIVFALGLFSLSYLVGFVFPYFYRAEIFAMLGELVGQIEGKGSLELAGFIFLNNMKVSLLAILLGIGIALFPIIATVTNGYLIGFVSREAAVAEGLVVLWRLFPHGIFEIPAVLFSIGIGIKIGSDMITRKGDFMSRLKRNYREGLRLYVFFIFPLLLLAGIIEGLLIFFIG